MLKLSYHFNKSNSWKYGFCELQEYAIQKLILFFFCFKNLYPNVYLFHQVMKYEPLLVSTSL